MHSIKIGMKGQKTLLVTTDVAIRFLDLEDARVLSTPQLIQHMEITCRDSVFPLLEKGHDTVGTQVNVSHLAAAPIGSVVTFTSEVIAVEDRRIEFRVTASSEEELIGTGTHQRGIINIAKFAARMAAKKQSVERH